MALLVNYEGTYLPPQKLWYLIDGVWTEVKQVFENNAQNELALLDQERIKQDQVVTALQTRVTEISAKLNGSDITIPIETDPLKINSLNKEIELLNLQLNVAKTEQVVMTKSLFEQKAQLEYIKLIGEGEKALSKIASIVTNPVEWLCIRIAPQSTLDERLELAIQHGLPDDSRIFNYGLVYYRLYKVNSTSLVDDLEYLKTEFKRRLSKEAFNKGIEPTNYILTVDSIQNIYLEVNQFVNSGAKRIEDYLANIKEQQKFILDEIEKAKESMKELEVAVTEGLLPVNETGQILTKTALTNLQVPLGEKLLAYQNVTSFDQLVSTKVLDDIVTGTVSIENFPGIIKLNQDANSLTEKIEAIKDFQNLNNQIQTDLTTGVITFNLNVLSTKKVKLNASKNLFWSTPLGNSTVSNSGGSLTYQSTYTSSGTYKFKNDELVNLDTTYIAIINALKYASTNVVFGVTFKNIPSPKIIQVIDGTVYAFGSNEDIVETKVNQKAIVNALEVNTKEIDFSLETLVNDKPQPHTSIVFVKENYTVTTDPNINLSVYHPVINGLFYSNTVEINFSSNLKLGLENYEYLYSIYQLENVQNPTSNIIQSFGFNTKEIPLTDYFINNDNIITQVSEELKPNEFSFNTKEIPLNDYFINNDNIILQDSSIEPVFILFNTKQTNNYEKIKNGYSTYSDEMVTSIDPLIPGFNIISYTIPSSFVNSFENYKNLMTKNNTLELGQKTRNILTSQTGVSIYEFLYPSDILNKLADSTQKILTAQSVRINVFDFNEDKLNRISRVDENAYQITTMIKEAYFDASKVESDLTNNNNYINSLTNDTTQILMHQNSTVKDENIYLDSKTSSELLNKDLTSIVTLATQLNPGVIL